MDGNYFNLEAENVIIGSAITYPELVPKVTMLDQGMFYDQRNQRVLVAIKALEKQKLTPDLVTVCNWLTENDRQGDRLDAHIMECVKEVIGPSFLKQHIDILKRCWSRRRQRLIMNEYAKRLDGGGDPDECRDWAMMQLKNEKASGKSGLIHIQEALLNTYEHLEQDQQKEGEPEKKIMSGNVSIDVKLGGLKGALYVAVGARPSVGKSIFALTYCLNAAKQGKRVLLVSLEMDEEQITERIIANQSGVTLKEITSGKITDEGWEGMAKALGPIAGLPMWMLCGDHSTVPVVRRAAMELQENGGIDLIAIDYIQLMKSTNTRRSSRQEEVADVSRDLRLLAAELRIPIIVLTQLNRNSAKRKDGKRVRSEPTMSDARESGTIEQDANIFMLLHDPDESELETEEEKEVWRQCRQMGQKMIRIIVEKNRQGESGYHITVAFDGKRMKFNPIMTEVEPPDGMPW